MRIRRALSTRSIQTCQVPERIMPDPMSPGTHTLVTMGISQMEGKGVYLHGVLVDARRTVRYAQPFFGEKL